MVSKIVLTFSLGQILLAILFFYLLPISSASKYQKSTVKIEKSSKPIINLKQGKNNFLQSIIFSYYIRVKKLHYALEFWLEKLICIVFPLVSLVKKTEINFV